MTDDAIRAHDIIFVGRPELNSALGAIMTRIGLDYNGADFRIDGVEHASEYDGMIAAATNPLDPRRMVLVIAGNSALETEKLAGVFPPETEYAAYARGKEIAADSAGHRDRCRSSGMTYAIRTTRNSTGSRNNTGSILCTLKTAGTETSGQK